MAEKRKIRGKTINKDKNRFMAARLMLFRPLIRSLANLHGIVDTA